MNAGGELIFVCGGGYGVQCHSGGSQQGGAVARGSAAHEGDEDPRDREGYHQLRLRDRRVSVLRIATVLCDRFWLLCFAFLALS